MIKSDIFDVEVCVVGSANLDVVAHTPRIPQPGETVLGSTLEHYPGGKGLNQAVAVARSGAVTAFVGALGEDDAGRVLRDVLTAEQIVNTAVATVGEPTGTAIIVVDDFGENTIVVIPGANGAVSARSMPLSAVVLAQLEIPIETVTEAFQRSRQAGSLNILNPAPAVYLPDALLANCDVLIPNEHELELVGGADRALDAGCTAVLVTLGSAGAELITAAGVQHIDPFAVKAIDTVGAGDAFCGGFASRMAAGDSIADAARWAAAGGALATTVRGAVPGQPYAEAIRALRARADRASANGCSNPLMPP